MSNSRFEYVKQYEIDDRILPNVYIVIRIDGRSFHSFSTLHNYNKPNDLNGLQLMNTSALHVMKEHINDIICCYGHSDEYSFVFRKDIHLFNRRREKLVSTIVSTFTSAFIFAWNKYFPNTALRYPPTFDGRAILYATDQEVKDYLAGDKLIVILIIYIILVFGI